MNRRGFLKKAGIMMKAAGMLWALPLVVGRAPAMGADAERLVYSPDRGPGLKDIAAGKLHHGDDRFLNPFAPVSPRSLRRLLAWKLFTKNHYRSLYAREQVRPVHVDWEAVRRHRGVSVTFLKHAGLLIKDRDDTLLVDPVFFDLLWFIKDFSPLGFDLRQIPRPRHVLITHGHYDHLDRQSLAALGRDTHFVTPLGYEGFFQDLGAQRRTRLDWFDTLSDGGRRITLLPGNHWTMRNPFRGPNRSLWGAYLIETAGGVRIFVSGDTAYFGGFAELGARFAVDLAIFNLGAYEPRWFMAASHMNPEETLTAAAQLGAASLMVVHWGTFRLGDEPVYLPPQDLRRAAAAREEALPILDVRHGQTLFFGADGRPRVSGTTVVG